MLCYSSRPCPRLCALDILTESDMLHATVHPFWARGLYRSLRKAVNRVGDSTDGKGILVYDDGTMYLSGIARELIVLPVLVTGACGNHNKMVFGQIRMSQFAGVLRNIFVQLSIKPPIRMDTINATNDSHRPVDLSSAI
jgi:hypothetical protein